MSSPAAYAELHSWSNFSFLEGGSHPEEMAERAAALGLCALALTDRDGLYGMVRFSKHAERAGLPAICGAELTLELDEEAEAAPKRARAAHEVPTRSPRLVLLAENERGYANLAQAISTAQLRGRKRDARLHLRDLDGKTDGLIALSGGANGLCERALQAGDECGALEMGARLRELFPGAFYCELQHHLRPEDGVLAQGMIRVAEQLRVPYVATNGVAYATKDDALLADVLTCIKYKRVLQSAGTLLRPNHEHYLKSPAQMAHLFAAYPRAITATLEIAERCRFRLTKLPNQFPLYPVPPEEGTRHNYLRTLVFRGAATRYGTPLDPKVERQLEYELGMIARLDLAGYFLIVWDIVRAAQELRVLCQGRGSAANSAVCYALGITAVDPVGMELLFERFLTEERGEVPDIDIDFAHQDREKVIQYVYERYGRAHAAMTAEVITYHERSAIRDIGKALGLDLERVELLAREYDAQESLEDAATLAEPEVSALIGTFCRRIDGFPRHMGIHSGGMVITRDPLVRVAPVEWATMRDRTIVQWDKDDLQDLGLIKIDLLGLGMLSLLREAFEHFRNVYPERSPLSLATIPADDTATYEMLQRADSIGVFQVESRAQQSMLPRLKPARFYDIVIQVAIIRPGPIQGDMIHPFLRRRSGMEPVTYPHPKLKPILERTLGVPLFQEQGMRMAIEAAGFTPGQADQLRRAMGHKRSHERMAEIYPKLVGGMVANGIDKEAAEQLFSMLEGFADYGFPESHAASFALLAYASAYIKCHEPAIFLAAILNVQPMGFYSTEVLVNDARRHGVTVKPVAVNASRWWSFVEPGGSVRLGFHIVRGLGEGQKRALETALADGAFSDIVEFARRTKLSREVLENLAASGAFAPWFSERREAMWALRGLDEREARGELGRGMDVVEPQPRLRELAPLEQTRFDIYSLGLTTGPQPIAHFRAALDRAGVLAAHRLDAMPNNFVCKVGGLVITRQRPGTAKGFVFLTLEDETGLVNVIVRPDVFERYRRPIKLSQALIVEGKLQKESGCIDLLARRFWPLDTEGTTDNVRARNFH
ncbi:MAG TPA: error-prone DNA polymerase [Candidatus Acidoferrales bacterium]|nr:error-prone DNA polymerase [Candidatus Acidoferrales bacterium]